MRIYIKKPTGGLHTLAKSVRITKPRLTGKLPVRRAVITLTMILLNLATMGIGRTLFNFPLHYLVVLLDVMGVLCIHHMGDLDYGMDLLPFIITLCVTFVFQLLLAGPYFHASMALSNIILLFAMIVCIILVMQKGYGRLIWKIINFFNLLSAFCILAQMAFLLVGVRLDRLGTISNWFFNAWEFSAAFRPCGTYPEPAMFAQPGLLSLYYYLFISRNWKKAAIMTVALMLSTSVLGLLGAGLLYGIWILNLDNFLPIRRRTKWIVLVLSVGVAVMGIMAAVNSGYFIVDRILSGGSVDVRVLRSVDLYGIMSPIEKIIGIGLQNQQNYLNHYGIVLAHDTYETTIGGNREFAGSLGYVLCTTGFFGLVFFVRPFYRLFTRHGLRVKVIVTLLLFTTLSCAQLGNTILMTNILAIYSVVDMERFGDVESEGRYGS